MSSTQERITAVCDDIKETLLSKNKAYGDSALDPVRVFSSADPIEQLKVRIDDKISRISRGKDTARVPEDTLRDLIGYLVLLEIAQEHRGTEGEPDETYEVQFYGELDPEVYEKMFEPRPEYVVGFRATGGTNAFSIGHEG